MKAKSKMQAENKLSLNDKFIKYIFLCWVYLERNRPLGRHRRGW